MTKSQLAHFARVKKTNSVWTKNEINAFRKMIGSIERAQAFYLVNSMKSYRIAKEQSDFGIQWLRNAIWTKSGKRRDSALSRCFGCRERAIVLDFKKFTFEGLHWISDSRGMNGLNQTAPVYRCHAKNGAYFDYAVIHWGLPEVLS